MWHFQDTEITMCMRPEEARDIIYGIWMLLMPRHARCPNVVIAAPVFCHVTKVADRQTYTVLVTIVKLQSMLKIYVAKLPNFVGNIILDQFKYLGSTKLQNISKGNKDQTGPSALSLDKAIAVIWRNTRKANK